MSNNFFAVIMAGGGGTRLWPVSRKGQPKQMLRLTDDRSLFGISVDRIRKIFPLERIFVVTIADQIEALKKEAPGLNNENFIVEPFPRGTASVVGLAAVRLKQIHSDAVMAVLTADHIIENESLFHDVLYEGYRLAGQGYLVTMGIVPDFPSTGYGYIKSGEKISGSNSREVIQFVEKPDKSTAEDYLKKGNYYWNSGMFVWKIDQILDEFERQMPELFRELTNITKYLEKCEYEEKIKDIWSGIHPQTIDYGIMENAENVAVVPAEDLGWSDIGSWDSMYGFLDQDESGNVSNDIYVINLDSQNNLIFSENKKKLIAVIGLDDLVIVEGEKAMLVCSRGDTEKVKEVIQRIRERKLDEYL